MEVDRSILIATERMKAAAPAPGVRYRFTLLLERTRFNEGWAPAAILSYS
jgi:hypothetical protein